MLKRICLWTLLLAGIPAMVLAQTPKDRLTLDLYLELETVADPRLQRQQIHSRDAFGFALSHECYDTSSCRKNYNGDFFHE